MMGAIGVLSATAVLQAIGFAAGLSDSTSPSAAHGSYVGAKPGERLDVDIVQASADPASLSDVGAGSCRYVVIVSPTCSASIAMARTWQQARRAEGGAEVPNGWRVVWVAVGDSVASRLAFETGPANPIWVPAEPEAFMAALKVRAYPAHLILNRSGRLVSGDVGARLYAQDAYHDDCTIGPRASAL